MSWEIDDALAGGVAQLARQSSGSLEFRLARQVNLEVWRAGYISRFGANHGSIAHEPWLVPKRLTLIFIQTLDKSHSELLPFEQSAKTRAALEIKTGPFSLYH